MDLEKMKVVELRAELADRGLDTKGTKAVSHCNVRLVRQLSKLSIL